MVLKRLATGKVEPWRHIGQENAGLGCSWGLPSKNAPHRVSAEASLGERAEEQEAPTSALRPENGGDGKSRFNGAALLEGLLLRLLESHRQRELALPALSHRHCFNAATEGSRLGARRRF